MKKILVIGSAVVDVMIQIEQLPHTAEDIHIQKQKMALGGCAYNVSDQMRHFQIPYIPFIPIGSGVYGDFVANAFQEKGIVSPIPRVEKENGCCYCLVEADGERTFLSYHGAEYQINREWFSLLNPGEIESVYVCGLEMEEETGIHILEFLEKNPELNIYFAPGPRLEMIHPEKMKRLFSLHPVLHLNEEEALRYYQINQKATPVFSDEMKKLVEAAEYLQSLTQNTVFITLGEKGCFYYDGKRQNIVPSVPAKVKDTIGAGDSHIGALMSCLYKGMTIEEAVRTANKIAAKVVETEGALLPDDVFQSQFDQ